MKKRIMILGANTLQLPLIQRANQRGLITIVVSPISSEPGHKIASFSEICDVVDEKAVLALAQKYNIDGIITDQTDLPVRTMSYVSNEMGLPGNDYEVACLFTNKFYMREKCKEIGVMTLRYKLCHQMQEAIEFYNSIGGNDIIIKPVDNQGSKGIYRIHSEQDILDKFTDAIGYSRTEMILAEEYVVGQEFLVEGICFNYNYRTLCCGDTHYFDIPDVFSARKREFPSVAKQELVKKVIDINNKIARGFGLKQGITHGEYIVKDNEVILLEIAARGGGVFISSDLIPLQTGLSTEDFLIDIALGEAVSLPVINSLPNSCCYIAFFLPEGEITGIEGIEFVKGLAFTHHHNFDELWVGKKINKAKDKTGRFFVIVSAGSHEQLNERISLIQSRIHIYMDHDNTCSKVIWS